MTRRSQGSHLGILIGCVAFLSSVSLNAATLLWVSPAGDDANAGTQATPFRTLERAVEVIKSSSEREVIVYLADGTHRLTRPLVFDSRTFGPNGPVVEFRAAQGTRPVIVGSVQVKNWTLHDKNLNIYRADAGPHDSRHLYVNGTRAVRARTQLPDGRLPAGFLPSPEVPKPLPERPVIGGGIRFIRTNLNPERWRDPAKWSNPGDIEAVVKTQWKMMRVPVERITPARGKNAEGMITLRQPAWTNANLYFGSTRSATDPNNTCVPTGPGIWSFWQVTEFENAYEFLDQPGEWYLDRAKRALYYIPRRGEDLATADVELPVLEKLIDAIGTPESPVANLRFDGLTFAYATWLGPSGPDGYVSDQSGFSVVGPNHPYNLSGHERDVTRTPGNISFRYTRNITFRNNRFQHLGAVALDFGSGSQDNEVTRNEFSDISSAAIQLGGVDDHDARPKIPGEGTRNNTISNNLIFQTGREFVDSAAVFIGFTSGTQVSHNTISDTPWSGIAIGWGWGLLDESMFQGVPCAQQAYWGNHKTPTVNSRNTIAYNRISRFLQDRWDGGAIYSTGQQGQSMADPLVIRGNVADHKPPHSGGNTFYTDGGSHFVLLDGNVSYANPIGRVDLGPLPPFGDPLPYAPFGAANFLPYGGDIGGCRTYGDIHYQNNYWLQGNIAFEELVIGLLSLAITSRSKTETPFDPYSNEGFFNICPYKVGDVSYPINMTYSGNHRIRHESDIPKGILDAAGINW